MIDVRSVPASLFVCTCLAACWSGEVSQRERAVVLTAQDLSAYGADLKRPNPVESFKRTSYFDGTYVITYEYSADSSLYMSVSIDVEQSAREAHALAVSSRAATLLAVRAGGLTVHEDSVAPYRDESYFATMLTESSPVGHLVFVRHGTVLYSVILTGLVFDSPDDWRALLDSKLAHVDSLRPRSR